MAWSAAARAAAAVARANRKSPQKVTWVATDKGRRMYNVPVKHLFGTEGKQDIRYVVGIMKAMRAGKSFKTPLVERGAKGLNVVDGHHRFRAAKLLGLKVIKVQKY